MRWMSLEMELGRVGRRCGSCCGGRRTTAYSKGTEETRGLTLAGRGKSDICPTITASVRDQGDTLPSLSSA